MPKNKLKKSSNYKIKPSYSQRFNELILTFFYCGKSIFAPGTVGTIGAYLCWIFTNNYFQENNYNFTLQNFFWISIIILLTIFSIKKIPIYQKDMKYPNIDHKSIVVDEAIGIILALLIYNFFCKELYILNQARFLIYTLFCFIIFRFLDIYKPLIIGYCDKNFKNAFGVLFDDILCGIFAGFITIVVQNYTINSKFFELINC
jgi:phosphatidylglycerophosphatase A